MKGFILETSKNEGFFSQTDGEQILHLEVGLSKTLLHSVSPRFIETLDYIAVGIGPGSYTGTRVGVAFAKTLAFAKQIPVIGFLSPLAYLPKESGPFTMHIPGKGKDYCLISGDKSPGALLSHGEIKRSSTPTGTLFDTATLNLKPLLPYLLSRMKNQDFKTNGEVEIHYLYDLPSPKGVLP